MKRIPFWARNIGESVLCVRYANNRSSIVYFRRKEKVRRLLKMQNEVNPVLHLEMNSIDDDGYEVIFNNYQYGDAPLLILNGLKNDSIYFSQIDQK